MNRLFRVLQNFFLWLGGIIGLIQYPQADGSSANLLKADTVAPAKKEDLLNPDNPLCPSVNILTISQLLDRFHAAFENDAKVTQKGTTTPLFKIDFSDNNSLNEYQLIQLLTTPVARVKSEGLSRKKVYITDHAPHADTLHIALETHIAKFCKDSIQYNIPISQTTVRYFEINPIIVYLLKLFWILHDAIKNPEQINYPSAENDITEDQYGLKIYIAEGSEQASLLNKLLLYIKHQYDQNPDDFPKSGHLPKHFKTVIDSFTENQGNDSGIVLNKVNTVLTFFKTIMKNQEQLLVKQDRANDSKDDEDTSSASSDGTFSRKTSIGFFSSKNTTPSSSQTTPPTLVQADLCCHWMTCST